jgi:hypothetical protein
MSPASLMPVARVPAGSGMATSLPFFDVTACSCWGRVVSLSWPTIMRIVHLVSNARQRRRVHMYAQRR